MYVCVCDGGYKNSFTVIPGVCKRRQKRWDKGSHNHVSSDRLDRNPLI